MSENNAFEGVQDSDDGPTFSAYTFSKNDQKLNNNAGANDRQISRNLNAGNDQETGRNLNGGNDRQTGRKSNAVNDRQTSRNLNAGNDRQTGRNLNAGNDRETGRKLNAVNDRQTDRPDEFPPPDDNDLLQLEKKLNSTNPISEADYEEYFDYLYKDGEN
jgi:hypothetical protein